MNIKPLADNILIEPIREEEKTKSGILLPQTADVEGPKEAKVIAVGPGKTIKGEKVPVAVKVGDKVLYSKPYSASKIKVEEKELLIVKEEDILAILS
ncbi:co-chaperone GroES [Candidatus Gribaldobacteria bacterium]|nr:co-chaperone GroES [Candidatus Gribaldobacteria bacterium]